jgi:hypothetical protein
MTTIATVKVPDYNSAYGFNVQLETEKAYGFLNSWARDKVIWFPKKALSLRATVKNELGTFLCYDVARWFKLSAEQKAMLTGVTY